MEGILERLRILPLLSSGLEGWVVENQEGKPCHIFWLITSDHNPLLKTLYKGRMLPLKEDEYVVEGAFTLEEYQRMGILTWRRLVLYDKLRARGKKRVINYIRSDNLPSLLSSKGVGYKLFMIRHDKWRFFFKNHVFKKVPEDTPYPLEEEKIVELVYG